MIKLNFVEQRKNDRNDSVKEIFDYYLVLCDIEYSLLAFMLSKMELIMLIL